MPTPPEDRPADAFLCEEDAHRVLARAVELDARAVSDVSVAQLRSIATEAGIAPEALDRALREYGAGRLPVRGQTTVAPGRALSEQLRRFRRHVALVAVVAVAAVTPGDFVGLTLLASVPIFALYELCIYFVHNRERGGPSSPALRHHVHSAERASTQSETADGRTRSLSLRRRTLAPAV